MTSNYVSFLESKRLIVPPAGIQGGFELHDSLFPFQKAVATWALKRGRCATWLDTGLGKSRIEIEWARVVSEKTGKPVVIVTPLAVADQFVREGLAIGVDVTHARTGADIAHGVNVINYERFDGVDVASVAGVVLDESSRLKDYSSATRNQMIESCRSVPYRLAASATPAPNDTTELGNHAEFLGIMTRVEMLSRWFVHDGETTQEWRLKGHAVDSFWKWVAHWAMAARKPSDLGFDSDDALYDLPKLHIKNVVVEVPEEENRSRGLLFGWEARTLTDQRHARRSSLEDRVAKCAEIVSAEPDEQWVVWCNLNDESKMLASSIPGSVEVEGSMSAEEKERRIRNFLSGESKTLVSKPSICGMGLNMQCSARSAFVGLSHSWEQWYQAIRRQWRFGQKREVHCYMISSSAEGAVVESLKRKQGDADAMIVGMVEHMADTMRAELGATSREFDRYQADRLMVVPSWLARKGEI